MSSEDTKLNQFVINLKSSLEGIEDIPLDEMILVEDNTEYATVEDLETKQDVIPDLDTYVKNTDYATGSNAGVIKIYTPYCFDTNVNGILKTRTVTATTYKQVAPEAFIGKGTLENIKEDLVTSIGDNKYSTLEQYNYLDEKVRDIELFKFPNAVIIGEPTIQNGQVSGFSSENYMQFPFILDLHNTPFQIDFAFTTGNNVTTQQNILDSEFGLALAIKDGKGLMAISGNGTSWNIGSSVGTIDILPNTTYHARLTWDGMQYKTLISTNGTDYTQDMYLVGTQRPYPRTIFIGGCSGSAIAHTPHPFFGTINMNKSYLSTRGQVIWQGMDDAGLATRADISLSNLDELGEKRFNDKQDKLTAGENITIENNVISASGGGSYHPPILSSVWSDHLINDIQWLRADTFSWQSGDVYVTAYNTLVEEYATGTEETEGNITFRRSSNGFKIATSDMESAILTKYNSEGIAWYYILDTTNKQFKLPRTKWGYKGLRDTVGNDVGESLPNIEGKIDNSAVSEGWTGVFATSGSYSSSPIATTSSSTVKRGRIDFNASNSSSTYQDNAPVQERATQMYLYFYVGEYAREAIEQTAGLNVDLFNNKLDLNASNLSTQGMSYISGLGIPSDRYIELSVGASYSTYTAPANGWVCLYASNTSNANATVTIKNGKMTTISHGSNGEWDCATICPVRKNDTYSIIYTNVNNWKGRYFIYAQGEQ